MTRPVVLVTRPRGDAEPLAALLRSRGLEPVIDPLLEIRTLPRAAPLDLAGIQALLVTSANGARALAAATARRDLRVLAVGDASAAAARAAGFAAVESADGDVHDLARLVADRLDPAAGPLLHVAGSVVAGDLVGMLAERGFTARREVLYEALPAAAFSPSVAERLRAGGFDFALFFSPRTAARFAELAAMLPAATQRAAAICLSRAVADALAGLRWADLAVADRPTQAELLRALDVVIARRHDARPSSDPAEPSDMSERPDSPAARSTGGAEKTGASVPETKAAAAAGPATPPASTGAVADAPASSVPAAGAAKDPAAKPGDGKRGAAKPDDGKAAAAKAAEPPKGAPPPRTPPEAAPASAAARGRAPMRVSPALWPLVVLLLVLVGIAVSPYWAPLVAGAVPWGQTRGAAEGDRLQAIEGRLDTVEAEAKRPPAGLDELRRTVDGLAQRVQQIEQRASAAGAASGAASVDLKPLQQRSDQLEASVKALGDRVGAVEQKAASRPAVDPAAVQAIEGDTRKLALSVADLGDRLNKLEQRASAEARTDRTDQALLLATGQLREAAQTSRPFATELATAKALGRERPDYVATLAPLGEHAEKGLPSRAALTQQFHDLAGDIVQAERAPTSNDLGDKVLAQLRSLVTIRRVDGGAGESGVDTTVAAAEAALRGNDLAGAVAAVEKLTGRPAEIAKPWLDAARARLAVEGAIGKAEGMLLAALAQNGTPQSGGTQAPAPAATR